jgi:hypothetical protein
MPDGGWLFIPVIICTAQPRSTITGKTILKFYGIMPIYNAHLYAFGQATNSNRE